MPWVTVETLPVNREQPLWQPPSFSGPAYQVWGNVRQNTHQGVPPLLLHTHTHTLFSLWSSLQRSPPVKHTPVRSSLTQCFKTLFMNLHLFFGKLPLKTCCCTHCHWCMMTHRQPCKHTVHLHIIARTVARCMAEANTKPQAALEMAWIKIGGYALAAMVCVGQWKIRF